MPRNPEWLAIDVLSGRNRALVEICTEGANGKGKRGRRRVEKPTRIVSEYQHGIIIDYPGRTQMLGQGVIAGADDDNKAESTGEVIDGGGEHSRPWRAVGAPKVTDGNVNNPGAGIRGAAERTKKRRFPQQVIREKKIVVQYPDAQQPTGGTQRCPGLKRSFQRAVQRQARDEGAMPVPIAPITDTDRIDPVHGRADQRMSRGNSGIDHRNQRCARCWWKYHWKISGGGSENLKLGQEGAG